MKHKEGPLPCGCFLKEASPAKSVGSGLVLRDWRVTEPCSEHRSETPVVFSFCMTCGKIFDVKKSGKEESGSLSHGYCKPCGEEALKAFKGI